MNIVASTITLTTAALDATPLSLGDYHQYSRPDYFVSLFNRTDHYSTVHKTLIGEYACVQPNQKGRLGVDWGLPQSPWSTWIGTISEAVFLIGAERNTDHVIGSSYAPLLQNLNSYEWTVSHSLFGISTAFGDLPLISFIAGFDCFHSRSSTERAFNIILSSQGKLSIQSNISLFTFQF